jgi:hypothetical protein
MSRFYPLNTALQQCFGDETFGQREVRAYLPKCTRVGAHDIYPSLHDDGGRTLQVRGLWVKHEWP